MNDAATNLVQGPHLLYIAGDGVNFEQVHKILEAIPNFPIGPLCWLVRPHDRKILMDELRTTLPALPEKSELLLCPVSRYSLFESKQGGFGLNTWLQKHRGES